MLDLFLLWMLCRRLGVELRAAGQEPILFQVAAVVLWVSCEIAGGVAGILIQWELLHGLEFPVLGIVGWALGMLAAASIIWTTARRFAPQMRPLGPGLAQTFMQGFDLPQVVETEALAEMPAGRSCAVAAVVLGVILLVGVVAAVMVGMSS